MAGVTDLLVGLKNSSKNKDRAATESTLAELEGRHRAALDGLALPEDEARSCAVAIDEEMRRCRELSLGISLLEEITPRTSDALLAIGELISSRLVAAALRARRSGRRVDRPARDPRDERLARGGPGGRERDGGPRGRARGPPPRGGPDRRDGRLRRRRPERRFDDDARPRRLGLLGRALRRCAPRRRPGRGPHRDLDRRGRDSDRRPAHRARGAARAGGELSPRRPSSRSSGRRCSTRRRSARPWRAGSRSP